ncbi:Core trichothecene cluster (CTC) 12 [Hyphodiscus hymeniophilus]|uniref:Core trichothecene cluster (CTC) 12 n=1 Tax=Hyphodiscus hymeniophilus TaxID=353542 RepID=A0A9P6VM69_9HELO|nr:Core trichothecene cluster (CTC) 12 [Hyphodiscus hymeniophilus]
MFVSLRTIGTDLKGVPDTDWIPTSWSIASAVSFSLAGEFSDIWGRKVVILGGQVVTLVGAIVAATAHHVTTVIVGETLIGFGAGMIFISYAAIPEILPNKYRLKRGAGLAYAELAINLPWGIVATLVASQVAANATWRWLFWIIVIYAGFTGVGVACFYFPPTRPRRDFDTTRWQEFAQLDWIGMFLYTTGLTVFLVGLGWAGTDGHPWKSVSVIAPIILGALTFFLCFAYDWTLAKRPFFPKSLFFKLRDYSLILIVLFVAGMVFFSMASILPQCSVYVFNADPTQVGLIQLPNGFGQLVGGAIIPAFIHKIKHIRVQIIVAVAIQTIFTACYALTIPGHKSAWMALQFFGNSTFAWSTLCGYVTAGVNVPLRELGIATGIIGTFRNSGGAVGIAIFNTIHNGVLNSQLVPRVSKAALAHGFPNDPKLLAAVLGAAEGVVLGAPAEVAFKGLPNVTPALISSTVTAFRAAYAYSFQRVFLSTIPFGVIALVAAWFIRDASQYLTNHTAVHLNKDHLRERHPEEQ